MDIIIYSVLAIIYFIFVIRVITKLSGERHWLNYSIFQVFVLLSLAYDNAIIAAGHLLGEGELLKSLSMVRYWLHAFATPTLVLVGFSILHCSSVKFSKRILTHIAACLITVSLIIYQIVSSTLHEVESLAAIEEYGVLRYTPEVHSGPPFMVIIVGLLLLLVGVIVLIKQRWVWLFVGTLLLFVGQGFHLPVASTAITNVFELILMLSIWLTTSQAMLSKGR